MKGNPMNRLVVLLMIGGMFSACQPARKTAAVSSNEVRAQKLSPVYFEANEAQIVDRAVIRQNANWLKANRSKVVILEGHCDERGSDEFNLHLGDLRARNVMTALMEEGVPESQLILVSYGKKKPAIANRSSEGLQKNRRVELVVR